MIEFRYTRDESPYTTHGPAEIVIRDNREGLETMVECFEHFIAAMRYVLPEGAHIGYEYEEYNDGTPGEYDEDGHTVANNHESDV